MATPLAQMPKDQLDKLFELYLANQATTTRFPIMSSAGVILLGVVLSIGLVFAWSYYGDARDLLSKMQSEVASSRSEVASSQSDVQNLRTELAELRSDFEATQDALNKLQAIPSVNTLLRNTDAIVADLVRNPGFINEITKRLAEEVEVLKARLAVVEQKTRPLDVDQNRVLLRVGDAQFVFPTNVNMNIGFANTPGVVCFGANDKSRPNNNYLKKCF
jgi:hypothetical protein